MKVCIYGLGAIGGLMAGRLALGGTQTCAVARGATLEAVRSDGLTLIEQDGFDTTRQVRLTVSDRPGELGPQDLVVIAVKHGGLASVAQHISPLLGADTAVLTAMNGIPWWFCHGLGNQARGLSLEAVDPGGAIGRSILPERVIGCVNNGSASTPLPGVVRHSPNPRLAMGEPAGGADTPRCLAAIAAFRAAGFEVAASASIQQTIWFKLLGNMTGNPISALTGATTDQLLDDGLVRDFMSRCMLEAAAIGASLGIVVQDDPEARHAVTRRLGAFRTSMLQDVDAGRQLELDSLVGVVIELARQKRIATPNIDALFGLARLGAQSKGLYPAPRHLERSYGTYA